MALEESMVSGTSLISGFYFFKYITLGIYINHVTGFCKKKISLCECYHQSNVILNKQYMQVMC